MLVSPHGPTLIRNFICSVLVSQNTSLSPRICSVFVSWRLLKMTRPWSVQYGDKWIQWEIEKNLLCFKDWNLPMTFRRFIRIRLWLTQNYKNNVIVSTIPFLRSYMEPKISLLRAIDVSSYQISQLKADMTQTSFLKYHRLLKWN